MKINLFLGFLIFFGVQARASDIPVFDVKANESILEIDVFAKYRGCEENPYAAWIACKVPEGIQFIHLRDQAQNFLFDNVGHVFEMGTHYQNSNHRNSYIIPFFDAIIFSPDGQKALYVQEVELWLIDFVTKEVTNITPQDLPTYSEILVSSAGDPSLFNIGIKRIYVGNNGNFHTHRLAKHLFFDFRTLSFTQGNFVTSESIYTDYREIRSDSAEIRRNFVEPFSGNIFNMYQDDSFYIIRPDQSRITVNFREIISIPSNLLLDNMSFLGLNQTAAEGFIFSCYFEERDRERSCTQFFKLTKVDALTGKAIKSLDLKSEDLVEKGEPVAFFSQENNQIIVFLANQIKIVNADLEIVGSYQFNKTEKFKRVNRKYIIASQVDENKKTFMSLIDIEKKECRKFELKNEDNIYLNTLLFSTLPGRDSPSLHYYPNKQGALLAIKQGQIFMTDNIPVNTIEHVKENYWLFDLNSLLPQPLAHCFE